MMHVTAQGYQLRYMVDEDRILLSVTLSPQQELGMPITRRMTRNLLDALAKMIAQSNQVPAGVNPLLRDSVLDFQHSQSVANAVAEGHMRDTPLAQPPTSVGKVVREVKITPKPEGGLSLSFDNSEQFLTIEVEPARVHMVIETFVQMAERAGWEFPPSAAWLAPSTGPGAGGVH